MSIDPAGLPFSTFSSNGPSTTADAFFLADYASVENGRLFIGGGFFDHINVNAEDPVARATIVTVIRTPKAKWGQEQNFRISMVDADGRNADIMSVEGKITAGGPADHSDNPMPIVIPVQFNARLGHFDLILEIDGERLARLPLHIQVTQQG